MLFRKKMKNYFKYLKEKWRIESNFQFWLIFSIFGLSGTSTLFIKTPVYSLLGITDATETLIKIVIYLVAITPAYFILLLVYGTILGQFRFFKNFTLSFFRRLFLIDRIKSKKKVPKNVQD